MPFNIGYGQPVNLDHIRNQSIDSKANAHIMGDGEPAQSLVLLPQTHTLNGKSFMLLCPRNPDCATLHKLANCHLVQTCPRRLPF